MTFLGVTPDAAAVSPVPPPAIGSFALLSCSVHQLHIGAVVASTAG